MTIRDCEAFGGSFVLVFSTLGPTLRSLTTTALSTQICCVYELKLRFFLVITINKWIIGWLDLLLPLADAHGILVRGQQACHDFAAERRDEWNSGSGIDAAQFDIGKSLVSSTYI